MIRVKAILGNVVNDNSLPVLADFVADGGFDLKLATRFKPEGDLIPHAAGNPPICGYTRDRSEAHASCAADDI